MLVCKKISLEDYFMLSLELNFSLINIFHMIFESSSIRNTSPLSRVDHHIESWFFFGNTQLKMKV